MDESVIGYFVFWSIITAVLMGVTAFGYKAYLRKGDDRKTIS